MHRFFHLAGFNEPGDILLSEEESHHAMRVLRVRPGDAVELFDGRGQAGLGTVAEVSRREVRIAVDTIRTVPRRSPRLTLGMAGLHRDKSIEEVVRDATVLGADRLCFFRAAYSEKQPRIQAKWVRLIVEACKQCGRVWLPEVMSVPSLTEVLETAAGDSLVVASLVGPHTALSALPPDRGVTYLVGPEGDFSAEEYRQLRDAGALPISLGTYTLRSEMAVLTGLALIQHQLGRMG